MHIEVVWSSASASPLAEIQKINIVAWKWNGRDNMVAPLHGGPNWGKMAPLPLFLDEGRYIASRRRQKLWPLDLSASPDHEEGHAISQRPAFRCIQRRCNEDNGGDTFTTSEEDT